MHLNEDIIKEIIKNNIQASQSEYIAEVLVANASSGLLELIVSAIILNKGTSPFYPGDWVKIKTTPRNDYITIDYLIDIGLYENGYVFGKVIKSANWNDDLHLPYYLDFKVNLFYGKESDVINCGPLDMIKIDKESIPHFNGNYLTNVLDKS